jgi:hypothetical protein
MNKERLPFWHFFHRIEKELSYERWIEKYGLFERALTGNDQTITWDDTDDWQSFRSFCKILYLQDHRDETRFDAILTEAIEIEKRLVLSAFTTTLDDPNKQPTIDSNPAPTVISPPPPPLLPPEDKGKSKKSNVKAEQPKFDDVLYFHPQLDTSNTTENWTNTTIYLHTDEYFPVTRRQMGVAWQYLRRKEKGGLTNEINLPATIQKVAKEGLFLYPVMQFAAINRADNLIFFADTRGAMAPFHEFTRRLIHTAKNEGGQIKAPVYYFQNYPSGFVYKQENLSDPIKVSETLLKTNRNATLAIIISDAGAALSDFADESQRAQYTTNVTLFLGQLREQVAHIIWLNPMPEHRWLGTPAQAIQQQVTIMAPVFDEGGINFPNIVRLLLKKR